MPHVTVEESGIPITATMATTSTTTDSTSSETMASSSTPTEPSLTGSIKTVTISTTVQPTSTGFTMPFETKTTTTDTTTPSTFLSISILAEVPTTTEAMAAGCTPADPSLTNSIDSVITSATVQPTSTGFTMLFEPPTPPSSPSTTTTELETTPSRSLSSSIPAENSMTATVRSSMQSPSVETAVSGMKTNLPVTTNSATASFSASTDSPWKRNTTTPVTSITIARSEEKDQTEHLPSYLLHPPHDNWELNILLDKLAQNIDDEELERLKYCEYGPGSIRKRVFEEIKTPRTFFQYLQEMEFVSVDNLIHLQALLWHLDRKDLLGECVEYAKTARNALYFHQPSPEPVNGYRYAEFHVEGRDLSKYKRKDLEELRFVLSRRLCVPPEFIVVSGIRPSKSLVITIMIPEYHAEIFVELLKENSMTELTELGINSVLVHDQTFCLIGKSKVVSSEERDETLHLFEKLQRAQSLLDIRNVDILRLKKKLETAEKKHKTAEKKHTSADKKHKTAERKLLGSTLREINIERVMNDISELLKIQEKKGHKQRKPLETESALAYYKFAMKKVKASGHDTDDIMQLLEANTYFVSSKTNNECRQVIRTLKNHVEKLQQLWDSREFKYRPGIRISMNPLAKSNQFWDPGEFECVSSRSSYWPMLMERSEAEPRLRSEHYNKTLSGFKQIYRDQPEKNRAEIRAEKIRAKILMFLPVD